MPEEKRFYVYVHRYASGPKQGRIFYVGKGSGDRISSKSNRNPKWRNFSNKYGFTYELCSDAMDEEDAYLLEMWLIAKYRHLGIDLANLTGGGDGIRSPSAETRQKMSRSATGRKHTPESRKKMSRSQTGRKHPDHVKKKIAAANSVRVVSDKTRSLLSDHAKIRFSGIGNPRHDKTVRIYCHADHGIILLTKYEWRTTYNISRASSDALISGKRESVKGWRILDALDAYLWARHHSPALMFREDWMAQREKLLAQADDLGVDLETHGITL